MKHAVPIPFFDEVKEVHLAEDTRSSVLITPDFGSIQGRRRYNVIRVEWPTGRADCIGRELPLGLARRVAKRPQSEDGTKVA